MECGAGELEGEEWTSLSWFGDKLQSDRGAANGKRWLFPTVTAGLDSAAPVIVSFNHGG